MAGIRREGRAHRTWLDLSSELVDQPGLSFRFSVHRVLQSLEQLLHVRDARFERLEAIWLVVAGVAAWSLARRDGTAYLPDPSDQSLAVTYRHRAQRLGKPLGTQWPRGCSAAGTHDSRHGSWSIPSVRVPDIR
ncbi:MAG: hypothetical protein ACRD45_02980 [Bryobacteraceae bacterium]